MATDGTVVSYDTGKQTGVILGFDRRKYQFNLKDWQFQKYAPRRGLIVSFAVAGPFAFRIAIVGISSTIQ